MLALRDPQEASAGESGGKGESDGNGQGSEAPPKISKASSSDDASVIQRSKRGPSAGVKLEPGEEATDRVTPSSGKGAGVGGAVVAGGVLAVRGVYMLRDFRGIQEMKEQAFLAWWQRLAVDTKDVF